MLFRLRQIPYFLLGTLLGYLLASGPLADWLVDAWNVARTLWAEQRAARGGTGVVPLLVAGYLLGQGMFLLTRQALLRVEPARAHRQERLAIWDTALQLTTRFGLQLYLERCTAWAAEDPTSRTQALALFKIKGLDTINKELGTWVASRLLQRVAAELRSASLPDHASVFARWKKLYFPRPWLPGPPPARLGARWGGATFALAFRELDAIQAISITRDFATWIRHELASIECQGRLSVCSTIAVGTAGVCARGLTSVAIDRLPGTTADLLKVVVDPADLRTSAIVHMSDIELETATMERFSPDGIALVKTAATRDQLLSWARAWGPAAGLIAAAFLELHVTRSTVSRAVHPWPANLPSIQVIEPTGPRTIRIKRTRLADQASGKWRVTGAVIAQADPDDGFFASCQVHLSVENTSKSTQYLSVFDFKALDATGTELDFDPQRDVRVVSAIGGRWVRPGATASGWLSISRGAAPLVGLSFEPDRATHMVLREAQDRSIGDTPTSAR